MAQHLILLIRLLFSSTSDWHAYIFFLVFSYIYVVSVKLIIVGDLVCRARLTHRGSGHRFLDKLS